MQTPPADTTESAVYDSVWAGSAIPEAPPVGLETVMLQHDKLFVVLAVVLVIWFGLLFFLFRTDRRLARIERTLERDLAERPERHEPFVS